MDFEGMQFNYNKQRKKVPYVSQWPHEEKCLLHCHVLISITSTNSADQKATDLCILPLLRFCFLFFGVFLWEGSGWQSLPALLA